MAELRATQIAAGSDIEEHKFTQPLLGQVFSSFLPLFNQRYPGDARQKLGCRDRHESTGKGKVEVPEIHEILSKGAKNLIDAAACIGGTLNEEPPELQAARARARHPTCA